MTLYLLALLASYLLVGIVAWSGFWATSFDARRRARRGPPVVVTPLPRAITTRGAR